MKIKAILFTTSSLLALASAAANVLAPSPQQSDEVAIAAPAADVIEASGTFKEPDVALKQVRTTMEPINACLVCHSAINTCSRMCGDSKACKESCTCTLKKENNECSQCASIGCESTQGEALVQRRSEDDEAIEGARDTGSPVEVADALLPPPGNPCDKCQLSIRLCANKCATPGACDDTCKCYYKRTNRFCKECKIKCDCGHTCPRLTLEQRSIDVDSPAEDKLAIGNETGSADKKPSTCDICRTAFAMCQNKCRTPHRCDDCCGCYYKRHVEMCKDCKIPCRLLGHCEAADLSLEQRSIIDETTGTIRGATSMAEVIERGVPPIPHCTVCTYSINNGKKQCATPGACDDTCQCWNANHNPFCAECDTSCDCGLTCPRLARRQRQIFGIEDVMQERSMPIELLDDPNAEIHDKQAEPRQLPDDSDPNEAIGVPANPASECWLAVKHCQQDCATPGACDQVCNCIHKNSRKCKGVKLPCDCGHTCPKRRDMFIEGSEALNMF